MRLKDTRVALVGTFGGALPEDVAGALKERGATIVDRIGPDVEVVFLGQDPGPEIDTARELGVPVRDAKVLQAALSAQEPPEAPDYDEDVGPNLDEAAIPEYVRIAQQAPPPGDAGSSSSGSSSPGAASTQAATGRTFEGFDRSQLDKGSLVKIVGGLEGLGVVGEIFWWGKSKYGEGMRAGVSGPGEDESYWVDEENLGPPDAELDDDQLELAEKANAFGKGDTVRVLSSGQVGTIFWWGKSKYGEGMRAGVETESGETVWADAEELEVAEDAGGGLDDISDSDIPF